MTRAESILASRLMDAAAEKFHEHGCNDMDPEYFEDLTEEDLAELEGGYNAWSQGETGETCGTDEYTPLRNIGDDMWMAYLAAVIGRKLPCDHEWDGPRIPFGESGSVATCSGCGEAAIDLRLLGEQNPQRAGTPVRRETPGPTSTADSGTKGEEGA